MQELLVLLKRLLVRFYMQRLCVSGVCVWVGVCRCDTHHYGVLHFDDGTVEDGRGHRGDLEHFALPALAPPLRQRVPPEIGHQLLDLLALPLGKEGLVLVQGSLGHHDAGRAVLHLGEDLYRLALEKRETRSAHSTEREGG